jgi:hypothetical protein
MRTFPHFPQDQTCPICGTNDDKECWLMGIDGTADGSIEQAAPVHLECTGRMMQGRLRYNKAMGVVYCFVHTTAP